MAKPLGERISELIGKLGTGSFPTYSQLRIMLKAEGYRPGEVDRWFASQAAGALIRDDDNTRLVNTDVYLILDEASREPLAFWTEGQRRILPLDTANSESWKAANELRSTLRADGILQGN